MEKIIAAGQFKTQCLQLMEDVREKHLTYIITKHGTAVAKLIPIETSPPKLYGALKDSITITQDILAPIDEEWDMMK